MTETYKFAMNDALPQLHIPSPVCGHCNEPVEFDGDGGAYCQVCRVEWSDVEDGAQSKIDINQVDNEELCGFVQKQRPAYDYDGKHWSFGTPGGCILPVGHGAAAEHLCPVEVETSPA